MEIDEMRAACRELLEAAELAAGAEPPPGEWDAEQILAHVCLVNAGTIAAVCAAACGAISTYDNRLWQDSWTIARVIELVGDRRALGHRIELQAEALAVLVSGLTEPELDTQVPTVLVSHDALLVDDLVPLRALVTGLVESELPGHAAQLRSLGS